MVRLGALVEALGGVCTHADAATLAVDDVHLDSRRCAPGTLFAALPGASVDGARFAPDALARGAIGVLSPGALALGEAPNWIHPDARRVTGEAAALVHGAPTERLTTIGVTGTNGKSTVVHLIGQLLRACGRRPGTLGTLGFHVADGLDAATHTTPDATELARLAARHLTAGGDSLALEVSSHALDQERTAGFRFDVAVFTNLGRDHLDYHENVEQYAAAKARLFDGLDANATAVVPVGDPHAERMSAAARRNGARVLTYGIGSRGDLRATDVVPDDRGTRLFLEGMGISRNGISLPLVGRHNVHDALAALAAILATGASPSHVWEGLANVSAPPGRLEPVDTGARGFGVLVDYAHTPDALEAVLGALRDVVRADARLIVVFGCGGDRDPGKRAPMGAVAARLADVVFVTSDNPRGEEPARIVDEVLRGARGGSAVAHGEPDRRLAIRAALAEAREGDIVLLAGKGHETWQRFSDRDVPFDDRAVALEELP